MTIKDAGVDKYQLLDGILHDLTDERDGLSVRGYRNCNIIRTISEALMALIKGLHNEDEARRQEIEMLRKQLADREKPQGETVGGETYSIDLTGGGPGGDHDQ